MSRRAPSRSYEEMIERLRDEEVLISALLELTYRCNLDCFFCYNDLSRQGRDMEAGDWCRVLDEMAAMGALEVGLTGGEPMVHPGFWDVARHATDLGLVVRIKTNGHLLDESRCRRLVEEVQPFLLEISLHGARAETHERQTRIPGSFQRLLDNLETARAEGLRVRLKTAVTRWNEAEIEGIADLGERLGLGVDFDSVVTPRDDGDTAPLAVTASEAGLRRLAEFLEARRLEDAPEPPEDPASRVPAAVGAESRKSCGAGSTAVTIDPFGDVFPCVQWRRALGNVHDQGLAEIWSASPMLVEVRRTNREAGAMLDRLGEGARDLGFCMGLAEEQTGDPLAIYPQVERLLDAEGRPRTRSRPRDRPLLPVVGQDVV